MTVRAMVETGVIDPQQSMLMGPFDQLVHLGKILVDWVYVSGSPASRVGLQPRLEVKIVNSSLSAT